jgi:hypothetical protein
MSEVNGPTSSGFDVVVMNAGVPVSVSGDFLGRPVDAWYFSIITAFQTRASKITLAPGAVVKVVANDTDDGDLLPEDVEPFDAGLPYQTLSRAAIGLIVRKVGMWLGGVEIALAASPSTPLSWGLNKVITHLKSLFGSEAPWEEETMEGGMIVSRVVREK